MSQKKIFLRVALSVVLLIIAVGAVIAANAFAANQNPDTQGGTLWDLLVSGGVTMIFLGIISVAATASVIYHFRYVTAEKLTPADFTENLLFLLEKKEYEKAVSICRQQENMISGIALKGLQRISRGKAVIEEVIQYEGKARTEKLWEQLGYLGDMAVIAPMLGLLGTILGMIQAFNFQAFKAGIIKPVVLAQGLSKAMITTAFGLIIAVPVLVFYSYFRGRISRITSNTERVSSEIVHVLQK
jgi:biopolymer transport protein ExbB